MSAPKCPIGHIETLYDAIIAYYREKSNRNNEKCLYLKAIFCVLHNSEKSNSCNFTIPRGLGYRSGDRLAPGIMYSVLSSLSETSPAIAFAAASFMLSLISEALTSRAPLNMPGNASTLFI